MKNNMVQAASVRRLVLAGVFALAASQAFAAGGGGGGFNEVNNMATTIRTAIYTLVGILAGICLVWQCYLGFAGRKTWTDIAETSIYIIAAGASLAFAGYLFTKGASISF